MSQDQETTSQENVSKSQAEAPMSQAAAPKPDDKEKPNAEVSLGIKQSDPKATEDFEKIRRDQYELRDKLNSLRENDLFQLREKTSNLNVKFGLAALIIVLLGFFGVKLYFFDLDRLIEERIKERADKMLSFNEKFVRASTLVQTRAYADAIAIYQELYDDNPDNELLFYTLLSCLDNVSRYDDAMRPIEFAQKNGLLRSKYKHILSFNNAGYFILVKSFENPNLRPEAFELLRRAEDIGMHTDNEYLRHVLYNLTIYYAMIGKPDDARKYGQRFRTYEKPEWDWSPAAEAPWLTRLQKVKPSINEDLKTAFAK